MRTSESPIVMSVITSASARSSRAAAVGALSRIDHQTSVDEPGIERGLDDRPAVEDRLARDESR